MEDIPTNKRVAIIGAGSSGLTSIKCCIDEGLRPVCFEMSEDIGGLWNYSEKAPGKEDTMNASVYKSCSINTSKEMMAFSDFPIPVDFPPFMPHNKVLEYFRMYASHFNLLKYIKFNTQVVSVVQTDDHIITGCWEVTTRKMESGEEITQVYDGVMVCSGHHRFPHRPAIEGMSRFKGKVIHSSEYKSNSGFEDKKVLVLGMGNSAADIATDASYVAKQVDVSTRRGTWIFSRFFPGGLPADFLANTRFMMGMPRGILQWMVELMADFKYSGETYGLKASHRGLEAHPTIHDYITLRIMSGYIRMRPTITHFTSDGAVFDDGHFEDFDTVVMATGYDYKFPFLDDKIVYNGSQDINTYKFTFLPHLDRPESLAFIGLVQAIGAVMPIAELQARWYARIISGKKSLPSTAKMYEYVESRWAEAKSHYINTKRHDNLETYWVPVMDDIASEIGVKPDMFALFREEPLFAVRCFFGPCVPAQYRLNGPHSKPTQAKRMIESTFTNITKATSQTRKVQVLSTKQSPVTWSQRLMSIKVLLYTLTFVFVAFLLAHMHLI